MPYFAENLKRSVWVASGLIENGVRQFGTPVLHRWNWRTLSSTLGMMAYGETYMDYRRAITTNDDIEGVHRFDRVWLEREPSVTFDTLAEDADFYVFGINRGVSGIAEVTLKRLSQDGTDDNIS